jgi:hypothetical protein
MKKVEVLVKNELPLLRILWAQCGKKFIIAHHTLKVDIDKYNPSDVNERRVFATVANISNSVILGKYTGETRAGAALKMLSSWMKSCETEFFMPEDDYDALKLNSNDAS